MQSKYLQPKMYENISIEIIKQTKKDKNKAFHHFLLNIIGRSTLKQT